MIRLLVLVAACGSAKPTPPPPPPSRTPVVEELEPALAGPAPEIGRKVAIATPAVPAFDLPVTQDGTHSVKELRVRGKRLLDSDVAVHGVITWAYDCVAAMRLPSDTLKEVQQRIDEDPTICERAKFYVGDSANTPPEKSLWIVDVPRPYNKLELARIKKANRDAPDRCEPGAKSSVCPPYRVGDEVIVRGKFTLASPHAERNSDGLLVFARMTNRTQAWESPGTA